MEKLKMQAGQMPVVDIAGTSFYIDMPGQLFRQVEAPDNIIYMKEVINPETEIAAFAFNTRTKNIYEEILQPENIPAHVKLVVLPPVGELSRQFRRQAALNTTQLKVQKERQENRQVNTQRHFRRSIH